MSTASLDWSPLAAFLAVMQEGSLSGAARAMALAQPTVRRQIEQLESRLGVVLFTRAPNGLQPTDTAHRVLPFVEAMAATSLALTRAVSAEQDDEAGTVRLGCSEIVGTELLPPLLLQLARARPGMRYELALSDRNEDLLRRTVDIAIRMVRPTQVGLVARKVGRVRIGLFAHARYLEGRTPPTNAAELTTHRLVGADRDTALTEALRATGMPTRPSDWTIRTDDQRAQLAAVRAGLGIGVCQVGIAARDPDLVRVLPAIEFGLGVWLAVHEDLRTQRRVAWVFESLADAFERDDAIDPP